MKHLTYTEIEMILRDYSMDWCDKCYDDKYFLYRGNCHK